MNDLKFLNKKTFSNAVEIKVAKKKLSYLDAILTLCEKNRIEPEDAKKYLTKIVIEKFQNEISNLNLLKGEKVNALEL